MTRRIYYPYTPLLPRGDETGITVTTVVDGGFISGPRPPRPPVRFDEFWMLCGPSSWFHHPNRAAVEAKLDELVDLGFRADEWEIVRYVRAATNPGPTDRSATEKQEE